MISISFSIVFLTLVSVYLYANRACKRSGEKQKTTTYGVATNFTFVWILIGLLFFYITAVKIRSSLIFAAGNIVVEVILIAYLLKNKDAGGGETKPQQQQTKTAKAMPYSRIKPN